MEVEVHNEDPSVRKTVNSPPQIVIHATGVIENSPYTAFANDEWESIVRFITSKEHLRKNIKDVKYSYLTTRACSDNLFVHVVGLQILVDTGPLLESPRSYIWRHFGQESLDRGNGSSIKLTKIHQKQPFFFLLYC